MQQVGLAIVVVVAVGKQVTAPVARSDLDRSSSAAVRNKQPRRLRSLLAVACLEDTTRTQTSSHFNIFHSCYIPFPP